MNKAQSNLEYKKGYGRNYARLREQKHNKKKDYTVRELAAELNISPSTISQIESEKRTPTVEQVMIYKKYFGVSLDYLVGETDVTEVDTAMFCKYTGMSEAAVKLLPICIAYGKDTLSKMIENPQFEALLYKLGTISMLSTMYVKNADAENNVLSTIRDKLNAELYAAEKSFRKIIEEFDERNKYPDRDFDKELIDLTFKKGT